MVKYKQYALDNVNEKQQTHYLKMLHSSSLEMHNLSPEIFLNAAFQQVGSIKWITRSKKASKLITPPEQTQDSQDDLISEKILSQNCLIGHNISKMRYIEETP